MPPRLRRIALLIGVAFAFGSEGATAQNPQVRQGFWFSGGLGGGSLGCEDCSERETGLTGYLAVGGTINQRLILGGSTHGWTKTEDGVTLSAGTLTATVRFYPWASRGFFLLGGIGFGSVDLSVGNFSVSESGGGAVLGLGYDVRLGRIVSLTPFLNGVGISTDNADANFNQIGLAITVH
jgi:hypothetical protein